MIRRMLETAPVTRNLVLINIMVFVLMSITGESTSMRINDLFAMHYNQSPGFRLWQLVTYMFMHGSFLHLFFNMFALVLFGPELEWRLGRNRFIFYYMACGIGAGMIQQGVFAVMLVKYHQMFGADIYNLIVDGSWRAMHGHTVLLTEAQASLVNTAAGADMAALVNGATVGASGAIFGLLLAFAMIYPDRPMYIMFIPVPVKAKWVVAGYAAIELFCGVGGYAAGVAHFAHLGGMIVGLFIILYWRKKRTHGNGDGHTTYTY